MEHFHLFDDQATDRRAVAVTLSLCNTAAAGNVCWKRSEQTA
jgi:hypothetical protein